jgi:glucose-6-phosphate-specific signal transduction histidine kinase
MALLRPIRFESISDSELKLWIFKYRTYSFILLGIGAILMFSLIWLETSSDLLLLLFLVNFMVMMPVILRSNALQKELQKRKSIQIIKQQKQNKAPVNITIKFD